jgi:hypothetical protein
LSRARGPGAVLLCVLLAASFITAGAVLRAKTPHLALEVERLSTCRPGTDQTRPACLVLTPGGAKHSVLRIRLFVRYSDANATVEIVGAGFNPARTLARGVRLVADRPVSYRWNGRTDAGGLAPPGVYAVRVILPGPGRNILWVNQRLRVP